MNEAPRIEPLMLPGLGGSGPDHWQSRWEQRHGYSRLEQASWDAPRWTEWSAALESRVARASGRVVLVAHSLACALVARWAVETQRAPLAALLVAPADIDAHAASLPAVQSFAPMSLRPLPFATLVVASEDDPYVSSERAACFARAWESELVSIGAAGHINAASGLGDWSQGHALLEALIARASTPHRVRSARDSR